MLSCTKSLHAASMGFCRDVRKDIECSFAFCYMDSLFLLLLFSELGGHAETFAVLSLGISHLKCKLTIMRLGVMDTRGVKKTTVHIFGDARYTMYDKQALLHEVDQVWHTAL